MKNRLVVIPVYNEEDTISAVLDELCSHYSGDVLIVDDGSTDHSMERVSPCVNTRVQILTHRTNVGYGSSLIDGFAYAIAHQYKMVVTMDCDLQHEPRLVPEFFSELENDPCDILSGSRYLDRSEICGQAPKDRQNINRLITSQINDLTGYNLTDTFCGFKGYLVSGLAKLTLDESDYGFPLQFWIQAKAHKLTVREKPVARIYKNVERTFGGELDNPESRLNYYHDVINRELQRWNMM